MPVCGNYLFFELPKKIVLNPKDGRAGTQRTAGKTAQKIQKQRQKPWPRGVACRRLAAMGTHRFLDGSLEVHQEPV